MIATLIISAKLLATLLIYVIWQLYIKKNTTNYTNYTVCTYAGKRAHYENDTVFMVIVLRKDYTNANILAWGGGLPIVRAFMEMAGGPTP